MSGRRGVVLALGFAIAVVGAFVVLDRFGGTDRFADLPGDADLRLRGSFTPAQVAALSALPQAAAAECVSTLYGVTVYGTSETLSEAAVTTAVRSPALRRAAVRQGQYPAGDTQVLVDAQTAQRQGIPLGRRLTLQRDGHSVPAVVVGIADRPSDLAAGAFAALLALPAGGVSRLAGDAPCDEVAVQLHRHSEATAFQKAVRGVLGGEPGVTYDESLRGHV